MSNLILIGFKRSGKTSFGKQIAKRFKTPFIDTDDLIAQDCHAFYKVIGEESFRLLEKKTIFALSSIQGSVIATGGGTILDPEAVSMLKKMGKLLYLYVPKDELKKRLLRKPLPAFLDSKNPEELFEKMYETRSSIFEKIADTIIGNEEQLWEVIHSEPYFGLLHGESLTGKQSVL